VSEQTPFLTVDLPQGRRLSFPDLDAIATWISCERNRFAWLFSGRDLGGGNQLRDHYQRGFQNLQARLQDWRNQPTEPGPARVIRDTLSSFYSNERTCLSDAAPVQCGRNADVRLYAFDLLADDGVDMRDETLQIRKLWLGKLLKRASDGILLNEHEAGAIGAVRAGLQHGTVGHRVEACGPRLQGRAGQALDQSQKPEIAGDEPGQGLFLSGRSVMVKAKKFFRKQARATLASSTWIAMHSPGRSPPGGGCVVLCGAIQFNSERPKSNLGVGDNSVGCMDNGTRFQQPVRKVRRGNFETWRKD